MAETKNETKKKPQVVVPGLMRGLNKKVTQGQGGVVLPESSTTTAPVQEAAPVQASEAKVTPQSFNGWLEQYTGVKEQGQEYSSTFIGRRHDNELYSGASGRNSFTLIQ